MIINHRCPVLQIWSLREISPRSPYRSSSLDTTFARDCTAVNPVLYQLDQIGSMAPSVLRLGIPDVKKLALAALCIFFLIYLVTYFRSPWIESLDTTNVEPFMTATGGPVATASSSTLSRLPASRSPLTTPINRRGPLEPTATSLRATQNHGNRCWNS